MSELTNSIALINKAYGKGTVMWLSDAAAGLEIEGISTGILSLDLALGGKGWPRGRICELIGPESSGKTSLCLSSIAQAQNTNNGEGVAAIIDAEHALDPCWAVKQGVRLEKILLCQPSDGDEALSVLDAMIRGGGIDLIVVDSVAALVPKSELDGEMGQSHVGLQARMMAQAMRKLIGIVAKSKTVVLFINQIRMKIGNIGYGSPETTPGGNALKFAASCRVDCRRVSTLKDGETPIGIRIKAKIIKNKIAPPFKEVEFDLLSSCGLCASSDILDLAVKEGLITQSGSWFTHESTRIGQGRDKARLYLEENPSIMELFRDEILKKRLPTKTP